MEQNAVYNAINFSLGMADGSANTTANITQLATQLCPSENIKQRAAGGNPPNVQWASTNYVANLGGPEAIRILSGTIVPGRNPFSDNAGGSGNAAWFGFEGVTDGSSNTAMLSERLHGFPSGPVPANDPNAKRCIFTIAPLAQLSGNGNNPTDALAAVANCKSVPPATMSIAQTTAGHIVLATWPITSIVSGYNHWGPPNTLACNPGGQWQPVWGDQTGIKPPTSNHSGGVNVGFGDGSVKFVKDSVSLTSWWAIGTRNQGETVSADAF